MKEVNELLKRLGELDDAPMIWINKKVYENPREIERLKKRNENLEVMYQDIVTQAEWHDEELKEEIERLNNVINNFEEELERELNVKEEDTELKHNEYVLIRTTLETVLKRFKKIKGDEKKVKEKLKKYIEGLLDNNKTYVENGLVLAETDSLYSTKWLEDMCDDLLKIIDDEADENE